MSGDAGDDKIFGFAGDDEIDGGAGCDYLAGEEGLDTVTGGSADDVIDDAAATAASGGAGRDTVNGVEDDDDPTGCAEAEWVGVDQYADFELFTSENGDIATFTVRLLNEPESTVTIPVSSSNPSEGIANVQELVFTPANFDTSQVVVVTGQDDAPQNPVDGAVQYDIEFGDFVSVDPEYNGLHLPSVPLFNIDNDTKVSIVPPSEQEVDELGGSATFVIAINQAPESDVTFNISVSDATEGELLQDSVTFTADNWQHPDLIELYGIDDPEDPDFADGDQDFQLVTSAVTSLDPYFSGFDPVDVNVVNIDLDDPWRILREFQGEYVSTDENGASDTFDVVLGSAPTNEVIVPLDLTDYSEATLSDWALVFTPSNWDTPQTVTVTGVDDPILDGTIDYEVLLLPAISMDSNFDGFDAADVSGKNFDNENSGENPYAEDDGTYMVVHDETLDIAADGVLENDFDMQGDPITAHLVADVEHGTLTLNPDGSFTYSPSANFVGSDSFEYDVRDDAGNVSNVATVTISVTNESPFADDDGLYMVVHDETLDVPADGVLQNDFDMDGDPVTIELVADVQNGALTLDTDGSFTYTPNAQYVGSDSFQYRLSDGIAESNIATVTIDVTNEAPTADDDWFFAVEGETLDEPAPGVVHNDFDGDADPLTVTLVDDVTGGTLSLGSDGAFQYTPDVGTYTDYFTYEVSDGLATSGIATVTIEVEAGMWMAEAAAGPAVVADADARRLEFADLPGVLHVAIGQWEQALPGVDVDEVLKDVDFAIVDIPGNLLALASAGRIRIDVDAAGYGWFVDETPGDSAEFTQSRGDETPGVSKTPGVSRGGEFNAAADGRADGRMDLLTVVTHEIGHFLGYDDVYEDSAGGEANAARIAYGTLDAGVRRTLDSPAEWVKLQRSAEQIARAELWAQRAELRAERVETLALQQEHDSRDGAPDAVLGDSRRREMESRSLDELFAQFAKTGDFGTA